MSLKQTWRILLAAVAFSLLMTGPLSAAEAERAPRRERQRPDVAAFRARVDAILSAAGADHGYWGLVVADAATGEVLYARNAERGFIPASNAKLFTTALVLATLGPDYRFHTTIETRGRVDAYGRLIGDLVLVGRGDPTLSNRKFPFVKEVEREGALESTLAELADAIAARGVKQVEGDLVADDSFFEPEPYPSGWAIDDMLWSYGAPVSALAVNDNVFFLELRPGEREGDPAWYGVDPWTGATEIRNGIATGAAGVEDKIRVSREPGSPVVVLQGTMPLGAAPRKLAVAIEHPAEYAAALLKRLLEARGVRVYGRVRARHAALPATDPPITVLAEHASVPLAEIVNEANKISQNLHAELLLRTAARVATDDPSTEAALKFAGDFRASLGIDETQAVLFDGSGLSRRDLVTPHAVVRLLNYAATQSWGEVFRASLPIAGRDGTLEHRMEGTAAAGRIWAKTGSIEHVNALSGYATSVRGEPLIFSAFGNNHLLKGSEATAVLDNICVAMVEELGPRASAKKKRKR